MNFLNSFLLASSFLLTTGTYTASAAATAEPGLSNSGDASSALNTDAVEATLTQTLRESLSERMEFPGFAAEPTQEVIVRIKFQVDADNKIDLLEVSGSNRRINAYVMENLQGKSASEQPILPGVTFVSTLRFIL
jgi:Cft2 family RNA processing exonuclease